MSDKQLKLIIIGALGFYLGSVVIWLGYGAWLWWKGRLW